MCIRKALFHELQMCFDAMLLQVLHRNTDIGFLAQLQKLRVLKLVFGDFVQ